MDYRPWSYSMLSLYETCPKKFYHLRIAKDVKDQMGEHAAYGDEVHRAIASNIVQGTEFPMHLAHLDKFVGKVRPLVASAKELLVEQKLAVNQQLEPTGWFDDDVFCRAIVDLAVIGGKNALLVDWKTGSQKDDYTQLELMAAMFFHIKPSLEAVRAEFWWTKTKQNTGRTYKREEAPELWQGLLKRAKPVYTANHNGEFLPKPSGLCKKHCPVTQCEYCGV